MHRTTSGHGSAQRHSLCILASISLAAGTMAALTVLACVPATKPPTRTPSAKRKPPPPQVTIRAAAPLGVSDLDLGRPYDANFQRLSGQAGKNFRQTALRPINEARVGHEMHLGGIVRSALARYRVVSTALGGLKGRPAKS